MELSLRHRSGIGSGIALAALAIALGLQSASVHAQGTPAAPAPTTVPAPTPAPIPAPSAAPDSTPVPAAPAPAAPAPATAPQPVTRLDIVRSLITNHAAPGYRNFAAESARLAGTMAELCGAPGERRLDAARTGFRQTALAWEAVQHIRFGPAMVDDRHHRIEYWPDKHGQGDKQMRRLLADVSSLQIDGNGISGLSVALQGMTLLERILFGEDSAALGEPASDNAARCKLGLAVGRNIAAMAKAIAEGWQKDYVARAANLDEAEVAQVLKDFFSSFFEQIEIIIDLKIGGPLGKGPEAARPRFAEMWRSGLAERSIAVNLQALAEAYSGPKGGSTAGLDAIASQSAIPETLGLDKSVIEGFAYGANYIEKHPELLGKPLATEAGWKAASFLKLHLSGLRDHATDVLAPSLGITLGFNSRDGD